MGVAEDPGILPRSLAEFFDCMADSTLLEEELEDASAIQNGENGGFSAGTKKEGLEEGENRVKVKDVISLRSTQGELSWPFEITHTLGRCIDSLMCVRRNI